MGAAADDVSVEFFGTVVGHVQPLVKIHPRVPNAESVAVQKQGDVLLITQWNHPLKQGNVPGKLFEYLAARRPILGLGLETAHTSTPGSPVLRVLLGISMSCVKEFLIN
jgi:hypothetical protein